MVTLHNEEFYFADGSLLLNASFESKPQQQTKALKPRLGLPPLTKLKKPKKAREPS